MLRLVANLLVSEAKRRVSGGKVLLVASAIACLLRRRTMVAQAVGLHHKPHVRPEEVDAEPLRCSRVSGTGSPARTASGKKNRSSSESVSRNVRRSSSSRSRATPLHPRYRSSPARRASGSTRSSRSASFTARSASASLSAGPPPRRPSPATSMRVRIGRVTGIPLQRVRSAAVKLVRRWIRIPEQRRSDATGTEISTWTSDCERIPQSPAALLWLSTAPSPPARTAAIHFPWTPSSGRPTA